MKSVIWSRVGGLRALAIGAGLVLLAGCGAGSDPNAPKGAYDARSGKVIDPDNPNRDTVFGDGGLSILGGSKKSDDGAGSGGIGVNSFLWRASLDTVAFMPLASADPFGGVIITDWYSPAATPDERFKVTVYILDRRLRADGLKVAVFRQTRADAAADWADSAVAPDTAVNLENAILTRARELRVANAR